MKFELIPVKIIPAKPIKKKIVRKRRRIKRHTDELEIAYIKRITGKDIRPSLRR